MTFEHTSLGWYYRAAHGRVLVADAGELVSSYDLVTRAVVADRSSRITEQDISDMASEAKK
jgi:hypothetical protein